LLEFQIKTQTMQMLRSGSSKGNEVARRLNACEERYLQKEVCRFEKEHEKRMREFFNERHKVREMMKELRQDHVKNLLSNVQKNDKSSTLYVQVLSGALEQNEYNTISSSARSTMNLEVSKTQRKIGMIRSSSVPNLFTAAIKEIKKHDSQHDPRISHDKTHVVLNAKTHPKVIKPCHWMTAGEKKYYEDLEEENFESKESKEILPRKTVVSWSSSVERNGRKSRPKTSLAIRHYTSNEKTVETDVVYEDDQHFPTTRNERKRTKSDVTPFLSSEREKHSLNTRPKTSLSTRHQLQNENISFQQKFQLDIDKVKQFQTSKNAAHFDKSLSPRPIWSCGFTKPRVSSAKFLAVSETVIATQKLIKSFRRQQAIEKATEELKSKQNSQSAMNKKSSTKSLEPKGKCKSVVTAVIAANGFKRNLKVTQN